MGKKFRRFLIGWFGFCVLVSVYSFIGDCLFHLSYALENLTYLPLYIFLHLFAHIYLFPLLIFLYSYLFSEKSYLILKIAYVAFFTITLALWLYPDDWSLYIGEFKKEKQVVSYLLAGLTLVLFEQLADRKKMATDQTGGW